MRSENFPSLRLLSIRVENDCCFDFSSTFSFAIYLQTKCVRYYQVNATDAASLLRLLLSIVSFYGFSCFAVVEDEEFM